MVRRRSAPRPHSRRSPSRTPTSTRSGGLVVDRTRALRRTRARRTRAEELGRLVAARTAELDDAQRLKDRLVATVSHEFRTGLTAIGGYAELLELGIHGPLTDAQMSDIRRIRSAYEHLSLVVEDLLSYGRIVAGRLSVEVADVEVGEAIRGMAGLVGPQSQARGIRVELNGPSESVVARADPERFRQILLNVTGNAIKFSPRRSRIVIGWQSQADAVFVAITDSGPGVPEAERESIFQPFSRLENSRSVPGTGLGLAISRELARAMGGDLTVEQNPDGPGSCFNLRLPRSTPLAPGDASVR